jgi:hypothetical protein
VHQTPLYLDKLLKEVMLFNKPGLERLTGCPIGIILLMWEVFSGEDQSSSCKFMRWCRGCLGKGCSDDREMWVLPVGDYVEGELQFVMDAIYS